VYHFSPLCNPTRLLDDGGDASELHARFPPEEH
jgi:hypothetical protein